MTLAAHQSLIVMPLVKIFLSIMGGILFSHWVGGHSHWLLIFPAFFILNLFLPKSSMRVFRHWVWQISFLGTVLLCGSWLYDLHQQKPGHHIEGWIGKRVTLKGVAQQAPQTTPYGQKFIFEAQAEAETQLPVTGKILIYLNQELDFSILKGDLLSVDLDIKLVKSQYPGYLQYLHRQEIYCTGKAHRLSWLGRGHDLISKTEHLRHHLSSKTFRLMPDSSIAALTTAMLLGDKSKLDKDMKTDFAKAGLSHVLAISGLHIGIIFFFFHALFSFFRRLPQGRWMQTIFALFVLGIYAILTGCSPSVCRAVLMIATLELGKLCYLKSHGLNNLAAVGLFLLLIDPGEFFNLGFQLSFCAVGGIILIASPLKERLIERWPWAKGGLINSICVSLAAQVATAPLIIYHFGTFPTYFLLSNLVLLPVVAFGVNLGVIALLLSPIPYLRDVLFGMLDFTLWLLSTAGNWIAHLPGAQITSFSFHDFGFCVLSGMLGAFFIIWNGKKAYKWFIKPAVVYLSFGHGSRKVDFV